MLEIHLLVPSTTHLVRCMSQIHQQVSSKHVLLKSLPYPSAIKLAGDFNQLSDSDVVQNTGLIAIVTQPTRAASHLDRIYVSCPVYSTVRVVKSLVRSDHYAVVA